MFNQIRAEFYKLFHTKALYLTFALILAVFGIFSIGGQQQFVASSSSLDKTWKIGESLTAASLSPIPNSFAVRSTASPVAPQPKQ